MRAVAFVVLFSTLLPACDECYDNGQDSNACPRGGAGTEVRAELFEPRALGAAGDHFVSLITYFNNLDGSADSARWLVDLDRSGDVLRITETDLVSPPGFTSTIAADGLGSALVVEHNGARFLRHGLVIADTLLDGQATTTFQDGTYWIAVAATERQLLHFDTDGVELSKRRYADARRVDQPSLATDPLGDGTAAGWQLTETRSVVVELFHDEVSTTFELAPDPLEGSPHT